MLNRFRTWLRRRQWHRALSAARKQLVRQFGRHSTQVLVFDRHIYESLHAYQIATGQMTQAQIQFAAMLKRVEQTGKSSKLSKEQVEEIRRKWFEKYGDNRLSPVVYVETGGSPRGGSFTDIDGDQEKGEHDA